MPDPIRPLTDLASEAQEVPMLPPAEIRRRGERRRIVRLVGTAVAVLALIATLVVGALAVAPLLDDVRGPQWADPPNATPTVATSQPTPTEGTTSPSVSPNDTPTGTTTPPEVSQAPVTQLPPDLPVRPTWDNVATLEMVFPELDESYVQVLDEFEGMGQSGKGLCDPGSFNDPTTALVRMMGPVETADNWETYAIVLGYPDADAAAQGYDLLASATRDCAAQITSQGMEPGMAEFDELDLAQGDITREPTRAAYAIALGSRGGEELGVWNETLLVQAGERVAWLVTTFEGMDHNCVVQDRDDAPQCPFVKSLPDFARQLDR